MDYIVYQAYGNIDNLNECLYSLFTLKKHADKNQIIVYTDQGDYLKKHAPVSLNVHYRTIGAREISEWRGPFNFVHRFKIVLLLDLVSSIPGKHNILYVDTDTTFRSATDVLFNQIETGNLFMHQDEGKIRDKRNRNLIFAKITTYSKSKKRHSNLIPADQNMWNAGVLGFRSTDVDKLHEALDMTDKIYSEFPKHIVEQLAFSIVFSRDDTRTLLAAENHIFHYWNFKEFRMVLRELFAQKRTEADVVSRLDHINPERLIQPKLEYENLPFFQKQLKKILGKWKMPDYEI